MNNSRILILTSIDLDALYYYAGQLHLNLQVFFESHNDAEYEIALQELYTATRTFLETAFHLSIDTRYAPNYILQMLVAAAVALLKLLNSFFGFADYVNREPGVQMFWDTINRIRGMSVRPNDLPLRLAEVFAQMFNAWDTSEDSNDALAKNITNAEVDASLTLTRRYRMSMSHVFDIIWRWKEELHGERDKLKEVLKNPTSPIAMTHRSGSFSNGRRPSSSMMEDPNGGEQQNISGFGAFGVPLGQQQSGEMNYATSYDFFDPMGWYLNDLSGQSLPEFGQPTSMGW